ncbi:hypothetical protein ES708_03782 [subsurface metagenome]
MDAGITLLEEQLPYLLHAEVVGDRHGKDDQQALGLCLESLPAFAAFLLVLAPTKQVFPNTVRRVPVNRLSATLAVQPSGPGVEQLEVVVQLGHGTHGGPGGAYRIDLVDGDRRGYTLDALYLGLVHPIQELPGVG